MFKKTKKLFKSLTLGEWKKTDIKSFNDFYIVGIKGKKANKKDTLEPEFVKRIKFEIAVETGVKKKYITVSYVTLNFDDVSSSDADLNRITAYARVINGPSRFYIRAVEVADGHKTYREGKFKIAANINPQHLN